MERSDRTKTLIKRILACLMAVIMVLTAAPLGELAGIGFTIISDVSDIKVEILLLLPYAKI